MKSSGWSARWQRCRNRRARPPRYSVYLLYWYKSTNIESVCVCVGGWVCGYVGVWVCGCVGVGVGVGVGVWVCGCVGVGVWVWVWACVCVGGAGGARDDT
jgi:hypothetical protein